MDPNMTEQELKNYLEILEDVDWAYRFHVLLITKGGNISPGLYSNLAGYISRVSQKALAIPLKERDWMPVYDEQSGEYYFLKDSKMNIKLKELQENGFIF